MSAGDEMERTGFSDVVDGGMGFKLWWCGDGDKVSGVELW